MQQKPELHQKGGFHIPHAPASLQGNRQHTGTWFCLFQQLLKETQKEQWDEWSQRHADLEWASGHDLSLLFSTGLEV